MAQGQTVGGALGAAQVGHHHRHAAVRQNLFQRGNGGVYAGAVGHLKISRERHVKIYTNQGALALKGKVIQRKHGAKVLP